MKEVSLYARYTRFLTLYAFPYLCFGPRIEAGFVNTLARKAFAIEYKDYITDPFLLIDELINDQEFYWGDLYKFDDLTNT